MDWLLDVLDSPLTSTLINVGARIWGANEAQDANDQAAQTYADAADRGLEEYRIGADLARDQLNLARRQYQDMQRTAQPGVQYLQHLTAEDPYLMTPNQQTAIQDASREADASLAASGLRGAGRATTEAIKQVQSDLRANFIDQNQRRSDAAASGLAGPYFSAGSGAASTTAAGANIPLRTGAVAADTYTDVGANNANATTANGLINGQMIGSIGSIFANDVNDRQRESRYAGYREGVA